MSVATARSAVHSSAAPEPIGPYVQAVRAGDFLYCSGQIPTDPATGTLIDGDVGEQTRQVLANLAAVLAAAGATLGQVVKTTIFLTDIGDFPTVNAVYGEVLGEHPVTARSTVEVAALPRGAQVEIEAVAYLA